MASFLHERTTVGTHRTVRLIKGSHIIVPQIFRHRFAYIFQNIDRRIVFAIPYEREFTLIGTTDIEYHGPPQDVHISAAEVEYLCATVNRYFIQQTTAADVVCSYSGVRPLLEDESADPAKVTRDYALELDVQGAPILNVFGGKITTFRRLARGSRRPAVCDAAYRGAAMDRSGDAAGRRPARGELRGIPARHGTALPMVAGAGTRALCTRLRHSHAAADRRDPESRNDGRGSAARSVRARDRLPVHL